MSVLNSVYTPFLLELGLAVPLNDTTPVLSRAVLHVKLGQAENSVTRTIRIASFFFFSFLKTNESASHLLITSSCHLQSACTLSAVRVMTL